MKKKVLYELLLIGAGIAVIIGGSAFARSKDKAKEMEEENFTPTPVVLEIKTKEKPVQEEQDLYYHIVSKVDDREILRNYWKVYSKDNELVYEAEEIRVEKYVLAQAGLNLRKLPTLEDDAIVTAIPYRTEVYGLGENEKWCLIEYQGERYFCATEYLSLERPKALKDVNAVNGTYTASEFKNLGVIHWGGWKWTWYSQRVLPGGGLNIPGRHVDSHGYVCDSEGYIVLASSSLSKGTVVNTPFGKAGKVYDSGCAKGTLDVYTDF